MTALAFPIVTLITLWSLYRTIHDNLPAIRRTWADLINP